MSSNKESNPSHQAPPSRSHLNLIISSSMCVCACVCSVISDSLQPHELWSARLLCPWNFPARILEWVAISYSWGSSQAETEPASLAFPALAGRVFTTEPPGKPHFIIAPSPSTATLGVRASLCEFCMLSCFSPVQLFVMLRL